MRKVTSLLCVSLSLLVGCGAGVIGDPDSSLSDGSGQGGSGQAGSDQGQGGSDQGQGGSDQGQGGSDQGQGGSDQGQGGSDQGQGGSETGPGGSGGGSPGQGGSSSGQGGSSSGQGGSSSGQGGSSSGQGGSGGSNTNPGMAWEGAPGVSISKISLYQGVERPLMKNGGKASSNVPVVDGRAGLVRVFYQLSGGYNGGQVRARLTVGNGQPIEVTQSLSGSSSDGSLNSTINFNVPAGQMTSPFSYRVEILQEVATGSGASSALYPANGTESASGVAKNRLTVTLLPIAYGADGSNRQPDVSAAQVERYRKMFQAMYPVSELNLKVANSITWNDPVSPNGSGWSQLLNAVQGYRDSQNAPSDEYYYGIVSPASSFGSFCSGGCTSGLGTVPGPNSSYYRASIGLGFTGSGSVETAVHEVGHNHGREHAPCGGVSSFDQGFPYNGGRIGAWGYDADLKKLLNPSVYTDMMGYCDNAWLSDYTFSALSTRIQQVGGGFVHTDPSLAYDSYVVDGDGNVTSGLHLDHISGSAMGEPVEAEIIHGANVENVTAQFVPFDHLAGGILMVPRHKGGGEHDPVRINFHGHVQVVQVPQSSGGLHLA